MISVSGVTKKYGNFEALSGIDIEVPAGCLYAFLGPNGAGKTTTIKILTGILLPDSGSVSINGLSITENPIAAKRHIGYLPDIPNMPEKLTGFEYLNFIMDIFRVPEKQRAENFMHYAEMLEMDDKLNLLIEGYSLGMKKKIGILGALCHKPELLILDEPTSGLDPQSVKILKDILKKLVESGSTVFFSTHILEVAEKICDMAAIISRGKIVLAGKMNEILGYKDDKKAAQSLENVFLELTENKTGVITP
ncbi:MAG: ABC transporter ATP-binding protein [Candidatus Wallbacteria bacterium]